jgi:hypothetical protein
LKMAQNRKHRSRVAARWFPLELGIRARAGENKHVSQNNYLMTICGFESLISTAHSLNKFCDTRAIFIPCVLNNLPPQTRKKNFAYKIPLAQQYQIWFLAEKVNGRK